MEVPSIRYERPSNLEFTRFTDNGVEIMVQKEMAESDFNAEIYLEKVLFLKVPAVRGIKKKLVR